MDQESEILKKASDHVFELFKKGNTDQLFYHDFKHTFDVVLACNEIGRGVELSPEDLETVMLAAWFHDVGYLESFDNHEALSVNVASNFLEAENYDPNRINIVKSCILSTKLGVEPLTLLQEVICDADMKGLGSDRYSERTMLLKEECRLNMKLNLTDEEWLNKDITFLTNQKYYTRYAQLNFNENKAKNLLARKNELIKYTSKYKGLDQKIKTKEKELSLKVKKSKTPERGIETMFRTALKNHMELSAIADNKANMMLSISALVLSIVISSLASKLDTNPELIPPTTFMLLVCLITIVLATLSTSPKITGGVFTPDAVKNRKANLLFFGNFHKMNVDDYEWGMKEMMKDKDYLYGSLIRDLHSLGVVLSRKYKFLRLCYLIFMYGMIVSVLMFGFSILLAES